MRVLGEFALHGATGAVLTRWTIEANSDGLRPHPQPFSRRFDKLSGRRETHLRCSYTSRARIVPSSARISERTRRLSAAEASASSTT